MTHFSVAAYEKADAQTHYTRDWEMPWAGTQHQHLAEVRLYATVMWLEHFTLARESWETMKVSPQLVCYLPTRIRDADTMLG